MNASRIKTVLLVLITLLFSSSFVWADSVLPFTFTGAAYRDFHAKYAQDVFGFYNFLSYSMDTTAFTKLEGNFCDKQTGLAAGADINVDDNAVGKANKIAAYVGIKRLFLRLEKGNMKGVANWNGLLAPGQSAHEAFDNKFMHVDLILHSNSMLDGTGYWGVGYTTFNLPAEIQTTFTYTNRQGQVEGVRAFDPDFQVKCYSFIFGFDTFSGETLGTGIGKFEEGFGFFGSGEDRFGLGYSYISDAGIKAAEFLNPGLKATEQKLFGGFVENDTDMGFKWSHAYKYLKLVLGVGYEVSFAVNLQWSGFATEPGQLGVNSPISIFRYGPIGRVFMQW